MQAVQRDLKNYIKKHASRTIPVGYSAADVRDILQDTWAYMQCNHDDDASSSDFFGLNSYSWCGADATFQTSGYVDLVNMFKQSAIPVFVSCAHLGCLRGLQSCRIADTKLREGIEACPSPVADIT